MRRRKIDKKTIVLILLFISGLIILFLVENESSLLSLKQKFIPQPTPQMSSSGKNVTLPVATKSNNTFSVVVAYFFEAPVKEFVKKEQDYKLVLETMNKDIPQFTVTKNATILKLDNFQDSNVPQPVEAQIDEIKEGSIVQVGANYHLDTKSWSVAGITIIKP